MTIQQEDSTLSGGLKYFDNGLGARGVDVVLEYNSTPSLTATVFPIYDAHGNQAAQLSRSGSPYTLANQRTYDAWGVIRSGGATGKPDRRYCGNLGHYQDDETDLIYMRARYYDPARGRFINQDPNRSGNNWYVYCYNDPVNGFDSDGKDPDSFMSWASCLGGILLGFAGLWLNMRQCPESMAVGLAGIAFLLAWFGNLRWSMSEDRMSCAIVGVACLTGLQFMCGAASSAFYATAVASGLLPGGGVAGKAKSVMYTYASILFIFMDLESNFGG